MESNTFSFLPPYLNLPTGVRQIESWEVAELSGQSEAEALASDRQQSRSKSATYHWCALSTSAKFHCPHL